MNVTRPSARGPLLCAAVTHHLGARRHARHASDSGPRGTFDFKWHPGERLRVALVDEGGETERHLQYAAALLEECIDRWLIRDGVRVNLDAEIVGPYVPGGPEVAYDVLARCPARQSLPLGSYDKLAARAQLGSYARREDYGVPTLILPLEGPNSSWKPGAPPLLEDLVGAMHELGHVLGMPHAHQSAVLELDSRWQPATSPVYPQFFTRFGVSSSSPEDVAAFIEGDLKSALLGRQEHGHWWPFGENELVDSIMTYRKLDDCLQAPGAQARFGPLLPSGQVADPDDEDELAYWARPTEADFRLLLEMYGRRP